MVRPANVLFVQLSAYNDIKESVEFINLNGQWQDNVLFVQHNADSVYSAMLFLY